jgi:phosphotriesterase-related protein
MGRPVNRSADVLAPVPVQTFRGPVSAADLGTTLIHEHIFVRDLELERNVPGLEWEPSAAVERAVIGLTALRSLGVSTVVDLTVVGLGRDVRLVSEVAQRAPVHIVAATGLYVAGALPLHYRLRGPGQLIDEPEPLIDLFVRDIEQGIDGTTVRAGMIKVTSEGEQLSEAEERVLTAAAVAHQQTGVTITTHSAPHLRNGLAQLAFLRRHGVSSERVIVGHSGDTDDLDYLRALMDTGATIGLDRFGMEHVQDDRTRLDTAIALVRLGYVDRMVLSHDAAFYSHVTPPTWRAAHAPHWHMEHLHRSIVPELLDHGVSQADIDRMLIANPRSLLTTGEGDRP